MIKNDCTIPATETDLSAHHIAWCEGKPSYVSKAEAIRSLQHRARRHKGTAAAKNLVPYRCPVCKTWHIGSR